MKKKQLSEGLFDSIVGSIMLWATKKDIKNDPEFRKTIADYQTTIEAMSRDIEDAIKDIEKRHGKVKRF